MTYNFAELLKKEFKYNLQEGEQFVIYKDHSLIIIHRERKPKIVDRNGVIIEMNLYFYD